MNHSATGLRFRCEPLEEDGLESPTCFWQANPGGGGDRGARQAGRRLARREGLCSHRLAYRTSCSVVSSVPPRLSRELSAFQHLTLLKDLCVRFPPVVLPTCPFALTTLVSRINKSQKKWKTNPVRKRRFSLGEFQLIFGRCEASTYLRSVNLLLFIGCFEMSLRFYFPLRCGGVTTLAWFRAFFVQIVDQTF